MQIAQECTLIYVSECATKAFEAFEMMAFDYLLKPINFERFELCIHKFINVSLLTPLNHSSFDLRTLPIRESFFIKADIKGQKLISIKCSEVVFIEADSNYVYIHLEGQKRFICHNTMKEMEENLPLAYFIRVHKSFIINYERVSSIEGNTLILDKNEKMKITIGNTYRKAFFERKNLKMIKKNRSSLQPQEFYFHTA